MIDEAAVGCQVETMQVWKTRDRPQDLLGLLHLSIVMMKPNSKAAAKQ